MMEIRQLGLFISLFTCLIFASFSLDMKLVKTDFSFGAPSNVKLELYNFSEGVSCLVNHPGNNNSSDTWVSTSNSTACVTLLYDEPGKYLFQVNCFTKDNQNASLEMYLTVSEMVSGLSITAPETYNGRSILYIDKLTKTATLDFRIENGSSVTAAVKVNNLTKEGISIDTSQTSRTGTVTIPQLETGNIEVELSVFNPISSVTITENMIAVEPIGDLYLNFLTPNVVNTTVPLTVSTYSGSNVQYEFCFDGLSLVSSFNNCYSTGDTARFNYTFPTLGASHFTVFAFNEGTRRNTTGEIELVNKIAGFRMSSSHITASVSDSVTLTLTAPDANYYPMEEMMIMYLRNEELIKEPTILVISPGSTQTIDVEFLSPGVFQFKAMVMGRLSAQNLSVEVLVADPLDLSMTIPDSPMRSDKPLPVTISKAIGWGFNYTLSFGDGAEQQSLPGAMKTIYNESLQFNHTYAEAGTYSITFSANNFVHQQEIVRKVVVLHPVPPFKIISNPSVSIPDGWATFNIESSEGIPLPTTASCSIDYGNGTRVVKDVDWVTGFPASNNYKSPATFHVTISCSNPVSQHNETFVVNVNDREIDIEGLRVDIPKYVLVDTKVIIELSIATGSKPVYRVKIGSEYDEVYKDKSAVTRWQMQYYFKQTREYNVSVTAHNSVSRIESSGRTSVVKDVKGFKLSVVPQIVSTTDDFKIFLTTPGETYFPLGPLSMAFYKDTELLTSKTVESPIPLSDVSIPASRWRENRYSIRAIVTSPVGKKEYEQLVDVEAPVPFFTFTVDNIVTVPDGIATYDVKTREDETPPTNASCVLMYGDGQSATIPWEFSISVKHTFVITGLYNSTFTCANRVGKRKKSRQFDVCEFNADGFRFVYQNRVPLNSSSPNVNVRFKYHICGLTSVSSDSQISWLFEPNSKIKESNSIDWEEEHLYVNRGSYNVKVFIKSLQTNTETMRILPLRIGILSLKVGKTIGRVRSDEFTISATGAYGSLVNFIVEFGDGNSLTVNKTDLRPSNETIFKHSYNSHGLFYPRVTVWSNNYVENITVGKVFHVQYVVEEFDIELDLESVFLPAPVAVTIHLIEEQLDPSISCFVDTGDTSNRVVLFNEKVIKYYSFRCTHVYKSYGPFDIFVNCSNLVSYQTLKGTIQLRTNSSPGKNVSKLFSGSFVALVLYFVNAW